MATLVNGQIVNFSAVTTIPVEAPPVVNAGDWLLMTGDIQNVGSEITFSLAGWTEIAQYTDGGFGGSGFAFIKQAVGNEDGTTVNVTASSSSTGHAQMFVVSDSGGLDDWARKPSDDAGTTEAPTAIDCTGANQLVVQVIHFQHGTSSPPTPTVPSGTTIAPGDGTLSTNFGYVTGIAYYEQASAGTAVTSTNTWGNVTDGVRRILWTFSFLNAGSPGGGEGSIAWFRA